MRTQEVAPPSAAVQRLLTLLATGRSRILVGLVGQPGAGKSTVAARWADAVNQLAGAGSMQSIQSIQVLGMDGFHLSRAALAKMPDPALALARRGAPWTFDPAALRQHLLALREGRAVTWPDFQHDIGDPVADVFSVPPEIRLVLVEGLYLLHDGAGWDLRGLFDEVWFLDVPPAQARRQLAERHQRAWGFTPEQAEARIDASDGLNAELVWAGHARADWIAPPQ